MVRRQYYSGRCFINISNLNAELLFGEQTTLIRRSYSNAVARLVFKVECCSGSKLVAFDCEAGVYRWSRCPLRVST